MTIQAQLSDGRVLEFPDGTDPAVVQQTVKRVLASGAPSPSLAASGDAGSTELDATRDVLRGQLEQGRETLSEENIGQVLGMAAPIAGPQIAFQALQRAPALARAAGVGLGAGAGDVAQQAGESLRGEREGIDPGQAALSTAIGAGAGLVGEAIAPIIRFGSRALDNSARALFRGGEQGRKAVADAVDDLAPFGASPSLATATERSVLDVAETITSRTPGGRAPIQRAVDRTVKAVDETIDRETRRVAAGLGGDAPSKELAGQEVAGGLRQFAARFQRRSRQIFDALDNFISPDQPIQPVNTLRTFDELTRLTPGAEKTSASFIRPRIQQMRDDLAIDASTGRLPFGALKELRTRVGAELNNTSLTSDIPRSEWKRIYGALSQDMREAARQTSPAAEAAFDKANRFYQTRANRIEKFLEPLARKDDAEKVFKALESGVRDGPTQIRAVLKGLNVEQRKIVAAAMVRRLGKTDEAGFSFGQFGRNWRNMDKAAKDQLFKATPGLRADLERIQRTAERIQRSSRAFSNPPGTAGALIGQGLVLGGAGAAIAGSPGFVMGLLGVSVLSNGAGRLMTHPPFIRWLARSSQLKAPGAFAKHVTRLGGIAAAADDDTREAISEFLDVIQEQPNEQPEAQPQPAGPIRTEVR